MKTPIGGGNFADLTPEQGAKASLDLILRPGQELNGKFVKVAIEGFTTSDGRSKYDGPIAPW